MRLTSSHVDFLTNVLRTAMLEGWDKDQFLRDAKLGWETLEKLDAESDERERLAPNTFPDRV
jgi:hypothetical protein